MKKKFDLVSDFKLSGDQPSAVEQLCGGLSENNKFQTLLGVTGSGKTFTAANVIARYNRPVLVISHNKILAAQLYAEFKSFFPNNAVEYFVSYYDYYQPEAYVPQSDTYIDKDSAINDHIERLRLKATSSLMERDDVIVVASVSCIYGLGSPEDYKEMSVYIEKGRQITRKELLEKLVLILYQRNDVDLSGGCFRVKGEIVDIFPAYLEKVIRVEISENAISSISKIDPVTGEIAEELERTIIYPARHFVSSKEKMAQAVKNIGLELEERVKYFNSKGKLLEAQRIQQRTNFDMEMMLETGFCHGIENYSRHISGRLPGQRPFCLLDFFPDEYLLIIDESHVSVPQINGMYEGDRSRKQTLVDYGFRLPSALDNRPLKFAEFEALIKKIIFVSATPAPYELQKSGGVIAEQVIRPTGLVDPEITVKPIKGQIDDLISEIESVTARNERALVTTLTKKMAEQLADYLLGKSLKVRYLHSEIDALQRVEIIKALRKGEFDVLVGINLLREGLDLPEVSLVAVLDADKEGFLRSETTLIQVCGRAARNVNGRVIFYADKTTGSMKRAMAEMQRRRNKQLEHNKEHGIKPQTIVKAVREMDEFQYKAKTDTLALIKNDGAEYVSVKNIKNIIKELEGRMRQAADNLDFETAAVLRDKIKELREMRGKRNH